MRKKLLNKSLISIILLIATLILGIFKRYIWVNFSTGNGEIIVHKYSFISITILGYGLFFPLLVILITIGLLIASIFNLSKSKKYNKVIKIFACIDIICLIVPVIIGMQIFNKGIALMLALLLCNLFLIFLDKDK